MDGKRLMPEKVNDMQGKEEMIAGVPNHYGIPAGDGMSAGQGAMPGKGMMGEQEATPGGPGGEGPEGPGMRGPGRGRPGKGGRRGGPPLMDESQMSEEERVIIPDFISSRNRLFQLDCMLVAAAFILGLVACGYLYFAKLLEVPVGAYIIFRVVIPTAINLLILFIMSMGRKKLPQNNLEMRQNFMPIFGLVLISIILCISHHGFFITLGIFCIPIGMTTIYGSPQMCRMVTTFCSVGVVFVSVVHYLMETDPTERAWIIPQGLIAICILVLISKVTQTLLSMTNAQRVKLTNFARTIKEEQQRAEAANRAKSAFLANMSHEIRTPINAILGMDEMILRENEKDEVNEYATSIYAAGSSLLSLVNDVLDISKIESDKLEIMENVYETSSFIHDCYNMISERAEKKGLDFKVDCDPNLPSQMKGDEARMRQVITNLLSNAVKYTEKGSITMAVNGHYEQEQFFLDVSVNDTGMGIKEENLEKLFAQFTRFDLERNRNIEGTGLGLAITKQLLDLMRGEIQVQSIYGVGSSFSIKVPQQAVDPAPMGDYHQRYRDVSQKNVKYQQSFEAPNARILVVDDVEVNLKVIVNLLKSTKIKVDTAISGMKCLEMVTQKAYDLIFMDHMMPEMNGIETYAKMKELDDSLNKSTPVIMLTANAVAGVREQYLKAGFIDYLSKPVLGGKLEKMIQKYLPENKIQSGEKAGSSNPAEVAAESKPLSREESRKKESEGSADGIENEALQKLHRAYPQADISVGLSYCGQEPDIYIEILRTFAENANMDMLNSYYEQKDASNYQILVHGVKSSSLSIGFTELSGKARALEEAARGEKWDFINEKHAAFVEEYQNAVRAITESVPEE